VTGVVVSSQCSYFGTIAYPQLLEAGLGVSKLGSSSVVYQFEIFRQGEHGVVAAGHFVHVLVRGEGMQPIAIPAAIHTALRAIQVSSSYLVLGKIFEDVLARMG